MAKSPKSVPVKTEAAAPEPAPAMDPWRPLESLRQEVDRLFENFDRSYWRSPFRRSMFDIQPFLRGELSWGTAPAVDIAEKGDAFEVKAELPGMDDKDVEVKVASGCLVIKGEKHEEKEEKDKDFFLRERRFGSFERRFAIPDSVDADKIDASFAKGVLTVKLPKKAGARKPEKKIKVKGA